MNIRKIFLLHEAPPQDGTAYTVRQLVSNLLVSLARGMLALTTVVAAYVLGGPQALADALTLGMGVVFLHAAWEVSNDLLPFRAFCLQTLTRAQHQQMLRWGRACPAVQRYRDSVVAQERDVLLVDYERMSNILHAHSPTIP